jgi:YgiT-type zinc finger domain-containing protein
MARLENEEVKETMTKCPFCGGKLEERVVTHPQSYQGKVYILENVPAEVCSQCGEMLLRPEVLEKMQQLVWSGVAPKRTTQVPIYDLAEVG